MKRFESRHNVYVVFLVLGLFAWVATVTAWLGDDVFISFRQIFNAINGYGFTFNFEQRVQAFTHPTWVLLLTLVGLITGELYLTTIVVSILLSLSAVFLLLRHASLLPSYQRFTTGLVVFFVVSLAFSKSFTDYMTSGLENPLSYFLVGLAVVSAARQDNARLGRAGEVILFLVLALALLNRFDYALLLAPLALHVVSRGNAWRSSLKLALPAIIVIVAWLGFATFYFGSPLPNTFYAKIAAGYPLNEIHQRGWSYFVVGFERDPLTLVLILLGVVSGLFTRRRLYVALSSGMTFYCLYIWYIGGDFMLGRFFSVLAYLSVFNLCALAGYSRSIRWSASQVVLISIVLLTSPAPTPVLSSTAYSDKRFFKGIADERGYYYQTYGLLAPKRKWPKIRLSSKVPKRYLVTCGGAGVAGLRHPRAYLIDSCGLTDPFIARLPAVRYRNWRIGHHERKIPTNYGLYLLDKGELADTRLTPLLADVWRAHSGDLFGYQRLRAIFRLNVTRPYDFDATQYIDPSVALNLTNTFVKLDLTEVNHTQTVPDGTRWDAAGNIVFENGLIVETRSDAPIRAMQLSLDYNDHYQILVNDRYYFEVRSSAHRVKNGGMVSHDIKFDWPIRVRTVKVTAVRGDHQYSLGHLIFEEI